MPSVLNWITESTSDAVKSIFSRGTNSVRKLSLDEPEVGHIALGFTSSTTQRASIAVVGEKDARETLAWVATYMPEAFPITQTIRVVGFEEFQICAGQQHQVSKPDHEFIWSSVILGEMLSQGHSRVAVDQLPISRAHGCYSFAVARVNSLYGSTRSISNFIGQRLRAVERDPMFAKRILHIDELVKIWSFADGLGFQEPSLHKTVSVVMSAIDAVDGPLFLDIPELTVLGVNIKKMSSGPIEQRVLEFERSAKALLDRCTIEKSYIERAPMYLAAFAFWVGSGTMHISLLDEFSDRFPSVNAWMGLFAGLAGPHAWDGKWLRGTSAIERLIRAPFSIVDPPTADLSWLEYLLISNQTHPEGWVKEIPKLSVRALSVELIAGATCQMRLAGGEAENSEEVANPEIQRKGMEQSALSPQDMQKIRSAIDVLASLVAQKGAQKVAQDELFSPQRVSGEGGLMFPKKKPVTRRLK